MLQVEEHDRMSMVMDGRVLKEEAELGKLGVSSDTGGLGDLPAPGARLRLPCEHRERRTRS
jgi:hypothetical protein